MLDQSRFNENTHTTQAAVPGNPVAANGFSGLNLVPQILECINAHSFTTPTEVQAQAIPLAMEGADLMVSASTGSGKTLAFMLPSLNSMALARKTQPIASNRTRSPRIVVLAPTRELAIQVAASTEPFVRALKGFRMTTIVGGVPYGKQISDLKRGVDILIGTPGRVLDHLRNGLLNLSGTETLVLDEADRMLDMGFIDDIREIAKASPATRQTLLFSATLDGDVAELAKGMLRSPKRLALSSPRDRHVNISQHMHYVDDRAHKHALLSHWLTHREMDQSIVFTSTQRDAEALANRLIDEGHRAGALHGGMPQSKRNRMLSLLRESRIKVLVATDVAARGIDVPTISHVINYGLPITPEDYVHRIGRTGRAGRDGKAISLIDGSEIGAIRRIERFTTQQIAIEVVEGLEPKKKPIATKPAARGRGGRTGGGFGGYAGERKSGGFSNTGRGESRSSEGRSFGGGASAARDNRFGDSNVGRSDNNRSDSKPSWNDSKPSHAKPSFAKSGEGFSNDRKPGPRFENTRSASPAPSSGDWNKPKRDFANKPQGEFSARESNRPQGEFNRSQGEFQKPRFDSNVGPGFGRKPRDESSAGRSFSKPASAPSDARRSNSSPKQFGEGRTEGRTEARTFSKPAGAESTFAKPAPKAFGGPSGKPAFKPTGKSFGARTRQS